MLMHTAWALDNCRVKLVEVVPVQLANLDAQKLRSSLVTAECVPPEAIDEWIEVIEAGNAESIVPLIVGLAPRIAEIDFACFRASGKWEFLARMFKQNISLGLEKYSSRFMYLRHVRLKSNLHENSPYHSADTADILSLDYLPNITYLAISIPSRGRFTWPMAATASPTRLSFLKLYRIREHRVLRTILAVCPALESFRFKWLHHSGLDQPYNSRVADLDEIASAIVSAPCNETLKDLKIDPTCKAERNFDTWSEAQPPPVVIRESLQALSQLPNTGLLWLPWVLLVGMGRGPSPFSPGFIANVLPRSIEEVTIADDFPTSDY
ncbi:hypothetical protein F5X68DRAFT_233660 [Plectosphaerella plurivora]|uniref:Uncharacterized protein n=1 Tax=Plectosphaerella plurivora TaxID=936078 RepID=A0A9P8V903_9PEZI|nr:hypothetical protein F5X68DRAFT_233660 [Plectosphaerella plurivora]